MFIQAVGGTNKPQPISTAIKTLDMRAPRKTKNGRCSLGNRRWVAVLDSIHVLLHCQCILVWVQLISYIYAKVSCAILVLDSSKIVIRIYNCADSSEAMSICFEIPCLWILQGLHHPSALTIPSFFVLKFLLHQLESFQLCCFLQFSDLQWNSCWSSALLEI